MDNEYIKNKLTTLIEDGKIKRAEAWDIYELYLEEIDDNSLETAIERAEQDIEDLIKNNS